MPGVANQTELLRSFRSDRGATAVEYAMMIALVGFVMMATVSLLGDQLSDTFGFLSDYVNNTPASSDNGDGDGGAGDGAGGSGDNNGWGDGDGGGQGHNG